MAALSAEFSSAEQQRLAVGKAVGLEAVGAE